MTDDEQTILDLTREVSRLKLENEKLNHSRRYIENLLRRAGVPSYFEDGNDGDDLSFTEQFGIFYSMYEELEKKK